MKHSIFKSLLASACMALAFSTSASAATVKPGFVSNIQTGSYFNDNMGVPITYDDEWKDGVNVLAGADWLPVSDICLVSKLNSTQVKLDLINGTSVTWTGLNATAGDYLWAKFASAGSAMPTNYNFVTVDGVGPVARKAGFGCIQKVSGNTANVGGTQYIGSILLKTGVTVPSTGYSSSNLSGYTRNQN